MRNAYGSAALAALVLAACGRSDPAPPPAAPEPAPKAAEPSPAAPMPGAALPPADAPYRYVGLWAADAKACADPPWRFEARKLSTQGEVSCTFEQVKPSPAGYDIEAVCTAEAPPKPYRLTLTFAESAKAMLVEGGPFSAPIGLVWCGPRP